MKERANLKYIEGGFICLDEVAKLLILIMSHACIHICKNAHK